MLESIGKTVNEVKGKVVEFVEGYKPLTPVGEKVKEIVLKFAKE